MSVEEGSENRLDYIYEYTEPPNNQEAFTSKQLERMNKIESAAANVHRVIEKYGHAPLPSLDPNDTRNRSGWKIDPSSAWANTSSAMEEIVDARERMIQAWECHGVNGTNGGELKGGQQHNNTSHAYIIIR